MIMRRVKKPYKKILSDNLGLLHFVDDSKEGSISDYAGKTVKVIAHYGPFRWIETEDGKSFYGVGKGLLKNLKG
jgi:hypothetical protein